MALVQIGEFDWLSGRQKRYIFVKKFKNLLLRNDKGETWHTCLGPSASKDSNCSGQDISNSNSKILKIPD